MHQAFLNTEGADVAVEFGMRQGLIDIEELNVFI
jgi:hypothetical protein